MAITVGGGADPGAQVADVQARVDGLEAQVTGLEAACGQGAPCDPAKRSLLQALKPLLESTKQLLAELKSRQNGVPDAAIAASPLARQVADALG